MRPQTTPAQPSVEQLALLDPPGPRLTDRQQLALDILTAAGRDGLEAAELGAHLHAARGKHPFENWCRWCLKDGRSVLEALRAKGLARYRSRLKVWQATELPAEPETGVFHPAMSSEIPY